MEVETPTTQDADAGSASQSQSPDDALAVLSVDPNENLSIMVKDGLEKVDLAEIPSLENKMVKTIMESKLANVSPEILVEGINTFINCLRIANFGAIAWGDDALVEEVHEVSTQMLEFIDSCFKSTSNVQVTCREIVEILSFALQFLMEEESEESDEQMKEVSEKVEQLGKSFKDVLEAAKKSAEAAENLRQDARQASTNMTNNAMAEKVGANCQQGIQAIQGFIQKQTSFWDLIEERYKSFSAEQASMKRSFKKVVKSKVAQMLLYRTMCGYRGLEEVCRQNLIKIREIREQFYKQCSEHPDRRTASRILVRVMKDSSYVPTGEDMDEAFQEVVQAEEVAEAERRAEEERRRADEAMGKAEEARRRAEDERRRADREMRRADEERRRRQAAEDDSCSVM